MIEKITDPSVDEETKIEDIAGNLYARILEETEKMLKSQLEKLGVEFPGRKLGASEYFDYVGIGLKKYIYSDDSLALASYEYNGIKILGVRISENRMGIEFDIPELKTENPRGLNESGEKQGP
uniref:Uncharacterized protein n=1 Tax=viral metagenome TaxID=1070528 RepID=A0A6M3IZ33_9ZZZZ